MQRRDVIRLLGVVLLVPALAGAADERKPLRYPFGLLPTMTPEQAEAQLQAKGLKRVSERDAAGTHFATWALSGQLDYESFRPRRAIATFDHGKLSSFSLEPAPLPDCSAAQPVYASALQFVHDNYRVSKTTQYIQEPAIDTLDCGPHFDGAAYQLKLASKDFLCSVIPHVAAGQSSVLIRYQWTGILKPENKSGEAQEPQEEKPRPALLQNL